jgi:hypothetical protein
MTEEDPIAELMTLRAEQVSLEIQGLLHGLGMATQGIILADLLSMWLAGQFDISEVGRGGPLTAELRTEALRDLIKLVNELLPESEKQLLRNVTPKGHG